MVAILGHSEGCSKLSRTLCSVRLKVAGPSKFTFLTQAKAFCHLLAMAGHRHTHHRPFRRRILPRSILASSTAEIN